MVSELSGKKNSHTYRLYPSGALLKVVDVPVLKYSPFAALTLEMFQPRGEEGEEKEVAAWRLRKYLRMRDNKLRPEFRKPADMPMSGPSKLLTCP